MSPAASLYFLVLVRLYLHFCYVEMVKQRHFEKGCFHLRRSRTDAGFGLE